MKPRHLWYKVSQNATRRSCKPKPNTDLKTNPRNASGEAEHRLSALAPDWRGTRVYSIGTTSRPINLATSSKWSESCAATARASRTRHSSSLISGVSRKVDGAGLIGKVRTSGIESPLGESRSHHVCGANASFWGSFRSAAVVRDRPTRRQIAFFALSKTATSPCRTGSLHRLLRLRASGLFPALQAPGALLYAARCEPL